MLPQRLVDHVHGPVLGWIGTRDARLRPTISWVMGARCLRTSDEIALFIPDAEIERTLRNVEHNGQVAATFVDPISHDAYQFKGKFGKLRPTTEEERAIQEIHREKINASLVNLLRFPAALALGYRIHPSTALTFKVEHVFVQTPGPGAGRQLELSELV
jgi:hypothetical protein